MRILGIDPGLVHTGWGIVECAGNKLRGIASGTISANPKSQTAERLHHIFEQLSSVIAEYKPATAAVEDSLVAQNSASALKLGMARGIALLAPAQMSIPVCEYSAKLVKKSVVGTGSADKNQIFLMVQRLLPGLEIESEHAADALAIAICHGHHAETQQKFHIKSA
ncbi:MAG: crossover junction endodeoxyribonuclease RuvC [Alphaproteobacteria bacterium]|nr:MAG: crossover junction endodeoxyribonuclease RuvC [Alphaproteobacteria bacterium]